MIKTDVGSIEERKAARKNIENYSLIDGFATAALFAGKVSESGNNLPLAAQMYKVAAMEKEPMGMRCLADMLMFGKGTDRDPQTAVKLYADAATLGQKDACFVMGELERNNGNLESAAVWYAKAHVRGFDGALDRISQMAEDYEPSNDDI